MLRLTTLTPISALCLRYINISKTIVRGLRENFSNTGHYKRFFYVSGTHWCVKGYTTYIVQIYCVCTKHGDKYSYTLFHLTYLYVSYDSENKNRLFSEGGCSLQSLRPVVSVRSNLKFCKQFRRILVFGVSACWRQTSGDKTFFTDIWQTR